MQPKPYLLFDAGGTLVFPDQPFISQQAQDQGLDLTPKQLFNGHCQLIYRLDCHLREHGQMPHIRPQSYMYNLLEMFGVDGPAVEAIVQACRIRDNQKSLWSFSFDWVGQTLERLAGEGYRMSVISNADGRAKETLDKAGLAGYFERVFDSTILGVEKPDPAIFEIALAELKLPASEAIYSGDVYSIDVVGANRAGLGCLHLDPLGLYSDWPGVHLPDVRHLPDWLARYAVDPLGFDLFPALEIGG